MLLEIILMPRLTLCYDTDFINPPAFRPTQKHTHTHSPSYTHTRRRMHEHIHKHTHTEIHISHTQHMANEMTYKTQK